MTTRLNHTEQCSASDDSSALNAREETRQAAGEQGFSSVLEIEIPVSRLTTGVSLGDGDSRLAGADTTGQDTGSVSTALLLPNSGKVIPLPGAAGQCVSECEDVPVDGNDTVPGLDVSVHGSGQSVTQDTFQYLSDDAAVSHEFEGTEVVPVSVVEDCPSRTATNILSETCTLPSDVTEEDCVNGVNAGGLHRSELTLVLGGPSLVPSAARQGIWHLPAQDTIRAEGLTLSNNLHSEKQHVPPALSVGRGEQLGTNPDRDGKEVDGFCDKTDSEGPRISETLMLNLESSQKMDVLSEVDIHDEGGTRGKRETSGNANLGLKEVEFKLDIGKRRLPSPDVKKKPEKVRAPEFIVKPRRQFVDDGQSAKFKVSYDGSPATVTWTKDGKALSDGAKYKIYEKDGYNYLEIVNVEPSDSGAYICSVQNAAGTDTASAELDVFEKPKLLTRGAKPPTLVSPLQDVQVALGDTNVRLECRVSDADDCQATWYHDGKELRQGRRYKCRFTGVMASLTITEIGEDDGGLYECVVSNASGEVRTSCTLSTDGERLEPPVFVKELQDMEVEDGDKVELVVEVKGTLPIHVYWLHNNSQVTVDTPGCILRAADGVHSLIIPHANALSAGEYVCEAYNDYGDTDTFCRINVTEVDKSEPPEFLTRPAKLLTIEEGAKATFTCCVKGHPPPVVRWERNGCTLSSNHKYQISSSDDWHSLEIVAPDKTDTGQYTCHTHNCLGSVSQLCSLVIAHTKPPRTTPAESRSDLRSRPTVGHVGKQGSTESERSDKENETRDFRSLLRRSRQATPPGPSTLPESRAVTGASSSGWPATATHSGKSGVQTALDLFEKNSAVPQAQARPSRRPVSAAPAFGVRSSLLQNSVFTQSDSLRLQVTPTSVKASASSQRSKPTSSSKEEVGKTDFRSVLSNRHKNIEKNVNTSTEQGRLQVKDSKPAWSKDLVKEPVKNGHNKDGKTLPSGRVDFRNVLKNRQSDKEDSSAPKTTESKPGVQSKSQRPADLSRKSDITDKQSNGHFHRVKSNFSKVTNFVRPVSTDVSSLKSKFETSQPQDFREVQLKSVKPTAKPTTQPADTSKSLTEPAKRPSELRVLIPDSSKRDFVSRQKEPEALLIDRVPAKPSAFSPPSSDSSYLSDSSKASERSKASEASIKSEDSHEQLPEVTSFNSRRWRDTERGGLGRRRSGDISQCPNIQDPLSDQRVRYGGKAVLKCKVVGVPEPNIKWSINRKIIKPSKYFQLSYVKNVAQLVVAEAFSEDEGEYTCTATNTAGSDSSSCYLTVEASSSQSSRSEGHTFEGPVHIPPRILSLVPRDITLQKGQPLRLEVTFCGEPAPVVRWFQAKTEISPDKHFKIMSDNSKSSLMIDAVSPSDAGRYTVTITNDLGSDLMSATLSVQDVPEPPLGKPHVYDVSKRSVSLSWCGPPFDGGSQVTHYAIEVRDSQSDTWTTLTSDCQSTSYHALNLTPEESYQFRVRAGNKLGLSEPSDTSEAVVMTDPLHTSEDYESDGASEVFSPTLEYRGQDELPFEPRKVDIKSGKKFEDEYELLHEVGKGKFGNVYKCVERKTGKHWAAKVVKCREKEKDNLRLEIEVMNQLAHPKLLMLWDAFEEPRKMVLIMEYVGAGELFERVIREDFVLTERDCVHFMRQICSGVGYMHSQSILHLDLKPENVLCVSDNSNQIKIIDFGLARFYKPGESIRVLFGTPEFIAPEVINYDEISFSTDLWSIGVICYVLLSGLSPFLGDNDPETLANVTSGEYDFDDDSFEDISDNAKDFIRRLLVKRKEKRNTISQCLQHPWLAQEDLRIRCKRLNTERLKCFMARRKWQKTGNAIRALGRMASLQKMLQGGSTSSSTSSLSSTPVQTPTPTSTGPGLALGAVFELPQPVPDRAGQLKDHSLVSSAKVPDDELETQRHLQSTQDTGESFKGDNSFQPSRVGDNSGVVFRDETESAQTSDAVRKVREETDHPDSTVQDSVTLAQGGPDTPDNDHLQQSHTPDTHSPSHGSQRSNGNQDSHRSPAFIKEMVDCRAFTGDAVRFDVKVTGDPSPQLIWTFEEEAVEEDERHIVELGGNGMCSLIVRGVTEDDEGEYSCRAVNRHGEATCSAELIICGTGAI